ncbi:MAG: Invasion associated locus B family protein [Candidatus Tokpelaia hoelldobleri]|uniref:Invasion associated locus B family protein n=1 Tax=Candidatus Tokpelaia hoelldobleri TaxID=1902579 RepID=A0A1U9JSL5_9HYPH|nr:MAG: Invasion associated locus B family protein [Candidatus Tokpelaia hoelldoblerii]
MRCRCRKYLLLPALLPGISGGLSAGPVPALADSPATYTIHPPALSVPAGPAGSVRRSVMQFEKWTLLCDENRRQGHAVCNATQSVHNKDGVVVFSWSLAASNDGRPFMLLRALPQADKTTALNIMIKTVRKPLAIAWQTCDDKACLAQIPLGADLLAQIDKGHSVYISYKLQRGQKIIFEAPFKGLKEAVASIR